MLVIIKDTGEEFEAKRWKDMTNEERHNSTRLPWDMWDAYDIFVEPREDSKCFRYRYDSEVVILSEKWTKEG